MTCCVINRRCSSIKKGTVCSSFEKMSELSIQVNYVKLICSAIIDPYHTVLPWNVDDEFDKRILL